jgi:cytosine/adenosine deaminase-related metal-dependent hydrolase
VSRRTACAPFTPEELSAVTAMAGTGPIHIHVAEQMREVSDCVVWSGARPVEWLLGNADVDRRWCLIHATHMTERETADMAKAGAIAGSARSRKPISATAPSQRPCSWRRAGASASARTPTC